MPTDEPPSDFYPCAVLGCGRIAQTEYIATEDGELAGWPWHRGDVLRFCWPHARNLYNGRDPLWEDGMAPAPPPTHHHNQP